MIKEFLLKKKIERSIRISLKNKDELKVLEDEIFRQVMVIETDVKFIYRFVNKNFNSELKNKDLFFWTVVCMSVIISQTNTHVLKFSMLTKPLIGCMRHSLQKI